MIQIKVKLFGAFRNFGNGEFLYLDVPKDSKVDKVKSLINQKLNELNPNANRAGLVDDSVLATDEEVLDAESTLAISCTLAILPPVCGG